MKRRLLIVAAVLAAVAAVLWLKLELKQAPPAASPASENQGARATVLLFADPREAEERCGCGEIIQMVRDMRGAPGVLVREIDSRRPGDDARRHGVRTSPTVLILDTAGDEQDRFEGESSSTITSLRSALDALRHSPAPSGEVATP